MGCKGWDIEAEEARWRNKRMSTCHPDTVIDVQHTAAIASLPLSIVAFFPTQP